MILPARVSALEIADGINRAGQRDEGGEADDERAQRIGAQKTAERRNRALRQNVRADFQRQRHERREGEQVQPFPRLARARDQAEQTGANRNEQEKNQSHGFPPMMSAA